MGTKRPGHEAELKGSWQEIKLRKAGIRLSEAQHCNLALYQIKVGGGSGVQRLANKLK
jgi:hypothetical protein